MVAGGARSPGLTARPADVRALPLRARVAEPRVASAAAAHLVCGALPVDDRASAKPHLLVAGGDRATAHEADRPAASRRPHRLADVVDQGNHWGSKHRFRARRADSVTCR
jgi:hypothetical protein